MEGEVINRKHFPFWSLKMETFSVPSLEVSLDVFNVANLLNKDWGVGKNLSNVPLYYITGFDQEKKQYKYAVNTNAGVAGGNGNPYQCQLGIRYRF